MGAFDVDRVADLQRGRQFNDPHLEVIVIMGNCRKIKIVSSNDSKLKRTLKIVVSTEIDVHIELEGLVDFEAQLRKLTKKHDKLNYREKTMKLKIENKKYLERVPVLVQEKDIEKFNEAELLGWRVFHVTPKDLENGSADLLMKRIVAELVTNETDELPSA